MAMRQWNKNINSEPKIQVGTDLQVISRDSLLNCGGHHLYGTVVLTPFSFFLLYPSKIRKAN